MTRARALLGCIADDFTGATDLANNLVRAGMRVVQAMGVPTAPLDTEADAIVVALKSRTIPKDEAIAQSLAALQWLQAQGAEQIYFKYCSTFDSTAEGNIGPVTDALMQALGTDFTIATPAFPDNKRTVFKGYLFVGDVLLNESGMQNHPLTPMTDPNLVRVLQAQTPSRVGLIDHSVVAQGEAAIRARIDQLKAEGVRMAVVDAVSNADLLRLGPALKGMPLVTAGSGVAIGLPGNFGVAPSNEGRRACPPRKACRPSCRQLLGGHQPAGAWISSRQASPPWPSTRCALPQAWTWPPKRWPGPKATLARARCWCIPPPSHRPCAPSKASWALRKPGPWWKTPLPPLHAAWCSAVCASSSWRAAKPRVPVCRPWVSRKCALARRSTRRAVVPCRGPRRQGRAAHHAEVGQLWQHRLFHQGFCTIAGMTSTPAFMDESQARDEICRVGRSLFERGYVHATAGNIERAPGRWLPHHPHRCLPGHAAARAAGAPGRPRPAGGGRPGQQDHCAAPADLRGLGIDSRPSALRDPHPQHAPGGVLAASRHRCRRAVGSPMRNCCRPSRPTL